MNFKYLKDSLVDAAKAVAGSEAYKQAVDLTKDVAYKAGDTVHQYAVSAKDSLALAAGLRTLQNYDVERHQVATAGPGRAWKIFPASSRRLAAIPGQSPAVSIWILDKNCLKEAHKYKGNTRGIDSYVEMMKKSFHNLSRLKHPCILKLLEPLEETRSQLVLVTEPVWGSAHDVLTSFSELQERVPDRFRIGKLSEQEVKYGMLQLAEGLSFLGNEAGMVHRGLSLESIMITSNGSFRIAGLAWALPLKDWDGSTVWKFDYENGDNMVWWERVLRPPLAYVAPELLSTHSMSDAATGLSDRPTPAADVFSLAAIMYRFVAGREMLSVGDDTVSYWAKVKSIGMLDFSAIPPLLQPTMKAMVSLQQHMRPQALAITQSPYFTEDVLLRALKFLETMVQRSSLEKTGFLKDLGTFWERFDQRVLMQRVIPPLLDELRTDEISAVAVPLVLAIVRKQKKEDFQSIIMPALMPLIASAGAETMMHILRGADTLLDYMPRAAADGSIIPLIARAFDSGNATLQEEALRRTTLVVDTMEFKLLKSEILPRVNQMCLQTTSGGVRIHCLVVLAQSIKRLDKDEAGKILDYLGKITAVDKSPGTVMNTLHVGKSISKQWGPEMTATKVLPLLCGLLAANHSAPNFAAFMKTIREMLNEIEAKRSPGAGALSSQDPEGVKSADADPYGAWKPTTSPAAATSTPSPETAQTSNPYSAWKPSTSSSAAVGASASPPASSALPSWQKMPSSAASASASPAPPGDSMSWLAPKSSASSTTARKPTGASLTQSVSSLKPLPAPPSIAPKLQQQHQQKTWQESAGRTTPASADPFAASSAVSVGGGAPAPDIFSGLAAPPGPQPDLFAGMASLGPSAPTHQLSPGPPGFGGFRSSATTVGVGGDPFGGIGAGSEIGGGIADHQPSMGIQQQHPSMGMGLSTGIGTSMGMQQRLPSTGMGMQPSVGMVASMGIQQKQPAMGMWMGIQENHPQQQPSLGLSSGMGTSFGMQNLPQQEDDPFAPFPAAPLPSRRGPGGSLI